MIYSGFNGNKAGSDVLVSLNLVKQGLKKITDTFDVKSKRKTLSVRRTGSKSVARSVHSTCICGASDRPLNLCLRTQLPGLHVRESIQCLRHVQQACHMPCDGLCPLVCTIPLTMMDACRSVRAVSEGGWHDA